MQIGMGFAKLFQVAQEYKITDKLGKIIEKRANATHKPYKTMKTIFKGFIQNARIYHFNLKKAKANISTYYRDLRRCNKDSYKMAKNILEKLYLKDKRKRSINITIDGTFIGVRGEKYEGATKMYSGNKKDRGKEGYTIVTCFDSTNKMPITFETTNIHEIHAFETLIERAIEMEKEGEIIINKIVLDALYFNKKIIDMLSLHKFIIRTPSYEWLLEKINKEVKRGCKEIELWGNKVTLYWKKSKDKKKKKGNKYDLLITNAPDKRIWWVYGHYKQMIENYHNDLKNKFGIRRLPSQKLYAILVYFAMIIVIYAIARAILLGLDLNYLSCGSVITVAYNSNSINSFIENLFKLHKKKRR